jgi:hypothetical protein
VCIIEGMKIWPSIVVLFLLFNIFEMKSFAEKRLAEEGNKPSIPGGQSSPQTDGLRGNGFSPNPEQTKDNQEAHQEEIPAQHGTPSTGESNQPRAEDSEEYRRRMAQRSLPVELRMALEEVEQVIRTNGRPEVKLTDEVPPGDCGQTYPGTCPSGLFESDPTGAQQWVSGLLNCLKQDDKIGWRSGVAKLRGYFAAGKEPKVEKLAEYIKKLGAESYADRQIAQYSIGALGEEARKGLTDAANDRNIQIKTTAQYLLRSLGNPKQLQDCLETATNRVGIYLLPWTDQQDRPASFNCSKDSSDLPEPLREM